jgi:hypothetical protein
MLSLMTLLFALGSGSPDAAVQRRCEADCEAIMAAAIEWILTTHSEAPLGDASRMFIDTGAYRVRPRQTATAEIREQNRTLERIAGALGLTARPAEDDPGVAACRNDRSSPGCRAAYRTTFLSVRDLEITSPDEATIWARIQIVGVSQGRDYAMATQLHLERVDGVWHVVRQSQTLVT